MNERSFPLTFFDPLALHLRLAPSGPGFLESAAPSSRAGRFSLVPLRRRESFFLNEGALVRVRDGKEESLPGDPFAVLGDILSARRISAHRDSPFPGGFFGFFGYDLAGRIETLPRLAPRDRAVPQIRLDWVDLTAVYDHTSGTLTLASLDPREDLVFLEREVRRALAAPLPEPSEAGGAQPHPLVTSTHFGSIVRRAQEYIAAGDIYQANLSCRFDGSFSGAAADLYRRLRRVNPSPFSCLLQTPEMQIVSSSPERLVSLRGDLAETRPIAGTRPRGYTPPEDRRLGEELLAHPKERAEHIMLLDLERNDLGKVCRPGTVRVDELMVLERYSHVTHIVSNVQGRLTAGTGPFDLLRAAFPGGTITGVPKKRCMEIIEELEPVGRGTYTGSAGYISASGEMDLNILIRTFQKFGDEITYQAGAGIVADSVPEKEWEEVLAKGEALRRALL